MRRLLAEIRAATGPDLLGRDRPEQARRQGRLRRGEAGRLRRAHAASRRASASPPRRPGSCPGSGRRPPRAWQRAGADDARRSSARRPSSCWSSASARTSVASWLAARASNTTASVGARAQGRLRVARADLRLRHQRPAGSCARRWRRMADELCASLDAHGRSGRTIGIKVRLDDFTTVTRARTLAEADLRRRAGRRGGAAAARRVRARRGPVRLLGVRVAGLEPRRGRRSAPARRGRARGPAGPAGLRSSGPRRRRSSLRRGPAGRGIGSSDGAGPRR